MSTKRWQGRIVLISKPVATLIPLVVNHDALSALPEPRTLSEPANGVSRGMCCAFVATY